MDDERDRIEELDDVEGQVRKPDSAGRSADTENEIRDDASDDDTAGHSHRPPPREIDVP
jgi:hypothetical protein